MSKRLSDLTSTQEKLGDVEAQSSASSPYSRTPTILGDDSPLSDGQEKRILPRRDSSSSTLAQDGQTEAKSEARNEAAARRRVGGDGDLDSNVKHDQVPEKVNAYQVDWDGPDDPENPKNWSRSSRWYYTLLSSLLVFNATFASSSPGGIAVKVMEEFTFSTEIATLMISLFVGGYCVGPLFWGPLSEIYGRKPVFIVSFILYVGFQIGCALSPNTAAILSASPPPQSPIYCCLILLFLTVSIPVFGWLRCILTSRKRWRAHKRCLGPEGIHRYSFAPIFILSRQLISMVNFCRHAARQLPCSR